MLIIHGDMQCHGEFTGVEDIGLFKALVLKDKITGQIKYINISRENSIEEIVFESDEEKMRFVEACTPNSININR